VLRAAQGPLSVREVAEAILTAKGIRDATAKQRTGIEAGVRSSLENHAAGALSGWAKGPRRWNKRELTRMRVPTARGGAE